jgi:DNA-binding response OmpR family regulator
MDEARPGVLLIDDEKDIVRTFTLFLERYGYVVDSAGSGGEALDAVKVMLTGFPSLEDAAESLLHGADSYLLKPVDMNEVLEVIEEKLRKRAGLHMEGR